MSNITDSDDTVLDMPRVRVGVDKIEPLDKMSTTQRIMSQAKAHPIYVVIMSSLLTGMGLIAISIVTQPHIDAAQDAHLNVIEKEFTTMQEELKKVKIGMSDQGREFNKMNIAITRLITILEMEQKNAH